LKILKDIIRREEVKNALEVAEGADFDESTINEWISGCSIDTPSEAIPLVPSSILHKAQELVRLSNEFE